MRKYSSWVYVVFVIIMVALVVAVDFLFFKDHFRERLLANIGIVVLFAVVYLRFLK
jgi:hypothetical protein